MSADTGATAAMLMDLGWAVFPVFGPDPSSSTGCSCGSSACSSPAKHPATDHGLNDASRDLDRIDTWWTDGAPRSLAVATGSTSGIWVLDIDDSDALDRFVDLSHEHGKIAPTITSHTGRGFHLFFRLPEGVDVRNSAGRVAEGIDVRGTGGYVIVPPSIHSSGTPYRWAKGRGPEDLAPIEAPAWLLELVKKRPPPEPAPPRPTTISDAYIRAAMEAECAAVASAPEGCRNDTLNRAAHALARFVEDGADPYDLARNLAYAAKCSGLGAEEIRGTIKSAFASRGVTA